MTAKHTIRVSRRGTTVFEAPISTLYARTIGVIALVAVRHVTQFPQHSQMVLARLGLAIEAALQETPNAHAAWLRLCATADDEVMNVDVSPLSGIDGAPAVHEYAGGAGGSAAWPSGGGGGGGSGLLEGSPGGAGADGAIVIFHMASDGSLLDIDAFVMPGTGHWTPVPGTVAVKVYMWGGGGGGGGGGVD